VNTKWMINGLGLMLLTKWRYTKLYTCTLFTCGFVIYELFCINNRVFRKVRRLGDENGQFRHNMASNAELGLKILQKEITGTQTSFPPILVVNWVSFSCFLSACTAAIYIFTAPTCTTTIINTEPCALNVEFKHFIFRFYKISLLCGYHWKSE
jgi:hypothetical protein